jgi:hypothetical protein
VTSFTFPVSDAKAAPPTQCLLDCLQRQGDQMSFWKKRPNCSPNQFFIKINTFSEFRVKVAQNLRLCTTVFFENLPKLPFGQSGHPVERKIRTFVCTEALFKASCSFSFFSTAKSAHCLASLKFWLDTFRSQAQKRSCSERRYASPSDFWPNYFDENMVPLTNLM